MNVKGAATRLPTSRKAATMLLACTLLCTSGNAFAQTAVTTPLPNAVPSRDGTPPGTPTAETEANTAQTTAPAPAPQLWRPSNNPGDAIFEQQDEAGQPYAEAENPYEPTVDGGENPQIATQPGQTPGIRLGTFLLRPSISQTINTEKQTNTGGPSRRNYLTTGIRGTLTSDWSRHALTVTGDGAWERNFGSDKDGEEPRARLEADLRLDLGEETPPISRPVTNSAAKIRQIPTL